jgi:hypothetical protein
MRWRSPGRWQRKPSSAQHNQPPPHVNATKIARRGICFWDNVLENWHYQILSSCRDCGTGYCKHGRQKAQCKDKDCCTANRQQRQYTMDKQTTSNRQLSTANMQQTTSNSCCQ